MKPLRPLTRFAFLALASSAPASLSPALAQSPPKPAVFRIDPAAKPPAAAVQVGDGTGQWATLGILNPTTHAFAPLGSRGEIVLAEQASPVSPVDPTGAADASAALAKAVAIANSRMSASAAPSCIYAAPGRYLLKSPTPTFLGPGCVVGAGPQETYFVLDRGFAGDAFSWSDAWLGTSYPFDGSKPTLPVKAGAAARDFSVIGDRSAPGQQNALMFYDRDDFAIVDRVDVEGLPGRALAAGLPKLRTTAYMRESQISRFRVFNSGTAAAAAVELTTAGTGDATNEVDLSRVDIYGAFGRSLWIHGPNLRDITGDRIRIEGKESNPAGVQADLLLIGDPTVATSNASIHLHGLELIDPYAGFAAARLAGVAGGDMYDVDLEGWIGGGIPLGKGLQIDLGRSSVFRFPYIGTRGKNVTVGPLAGAGLVLDGAGAERTWTYDVAPANGRGLAFPALNAAPPGGGVDLQASRQDPSHTASASGSTTLGQDNTASGTNSTAIGAGNAATGNAATAIGDADRATGDFSFAGGQNNEASGPTSVAAGYGNKATGPTATVFGYGNRASGVVSAIPGGQGADDRGRYAWQGWGSGDFAAPGDAQVGVQQLRASGTGAMRLTADGQAPSAVNTVNLPDNATYGLKVTLQARDVTDPANSYAWTLPIGTLSRGRGVASVALSTGTPTALATGSGTASVTIAADVGAGGLALTFTPPSGSDTWHALARVETVEVR